MSNWEYIISVPGIKLSEPVNAKVIAFIGPNDERYEIISNTHENMRKYLDAFRDAFGNKLPPSIIIRKRKEKLIEHWDLACFRNIVAIPSVIKSRSMNYLNPFPNNVPFTDMFEFCLINIGKDYKYLVHRTPSETGANEIDKFSYIPNPAVIHPHIFKVEYDYHLMNALISLYDDRSTSKHIEELKNKVYRSLEMAFYALKTFTTNLGTVYDHGFVVSLWVPAFEILANPLKQDVSYKDVEKLINKIPWHRSELIKRNYKQVDYKYGKRAKYKRVSLPNQIYSRLRYVRNLILHGSPIDAVLLEPKRRKKWSPLIVQAPALYRCLLLSMLSNNGFGEYPKPDASMDGIWKNMNYIRYYEEILFKAPKEKEED